ncbi:nucleotidyltransferase substrate binding protein, HI0074 family [Alkaliphilus metalliredigens QYMF]|uniref:Nucleotidyltransferase substrate binding protein, HI0074 family n=1 Tax=Alkaliphilus metalliredigens (strain QYMF) TaxID=293826 RepID=A6TJR4_ALKMQ|nr:nucleotidyltransferase substrate binding protein [Alkaliphilus metalliredigens]ABR46432.1 nucleotidyltransferase substrate binding protein, HI0074 family [Alkaliphilus metalliredigens QYMF]
MDHLKNVRWKQRFINFEKSYNLLNQYINQPIETELERAGIIQFFEISFELSWKLMKDYLESQELSVKSPRETIKQAFQIGLIDDGHIWIDALSDRNLTVHTYDEKLARKMVDDIAKVYFPELKKLYHKLVKEL